MTLQQDQRIAATLPGTWDAFFSRFGRLTEVQRQAIPVLLTGSDALVSSPTASGKTEAVCAPLIERQILGAATATLLYISPTRALVNDLFARISASCESLGLIVARRTGDHPCLPTSNPRVLITTPESFDSVLCRAHRADGHVLADVRAVILDEVHLLYGTARGEQVRWLLHRLRRLRDYALSQGWSRTAALQVCALSATVDDPEGIRAAYLRNSGVHIHVGGGRRIEEVDPPGPSPATEDSLPVYVSALQTPEKILVFSNTRKRVDALAHQLRSDLERAGYQIRAHHGSLSRSIREDAEETAKTCARVVLFATSTLEIGIDIGDIDLVVLDGPAHDVRALLQRIGRGNRRTDITRVMPCAGSAAEMVLHAAMLSDARGGHLFATERGPQLAVARQQVVSYIFQKRDGQRARTALEELLTTMCPEAAAGELLDQLTGNGELRVGPSGLQLGEKWLEAADGGEIHSTIEAPPGQTVFDAASGADLAVGVRYRDGAALRIGGNLLAVRDASSARIAVEIATQQGLQEGKWSYVTSAWMQGAGQADALRRFLGIPAGEWPIVDLGDGTRAVFHFGGGRREAVLELIAAEAVPGLRGVDGWALYVTDSVSQKAEVFGQANANTASIKIPGQIRGLERLLARPHANDGLPLSWRAYEISEWLNLDEECASIRTAIWRWAAENCAPVLQVFAQALRAKRKRHGLGGP